MMQNKIKLCFYYPFFQFPFPPPPPSPPYIISQFLLKINTFMCIYEAQQYNIELKKHCSEDIFFMVAK